MNQNTSNRNHPRASARLAALAWVGLSIGTVAVPALAGPTLVSRDSALRASGVSAAGEYNLSNGSGDFDLFDDTLESDGAAAARSTARQVSEPRVIGPEGVFTGASAEGSAQAAVDAGAADAFSSAQSDFDVVFRIDGAPASVLLDCDLLAAGDATAGVKLYDVDTLEAVFSDEVSADGRTSRGEQVLAAGTYGLSAWAFVRGTPSDSTASYTIDLSLAASAAPVPMPLPAAAWAGLVTFGLVVGAARRARRTQPS